MSRLSPEPFRGAVHHDTPDLHHVAGVRNVERDRGVLLHQQHGDPALLVEPPDDGVEVADQDGDRPSDGSSSSMILGRAMSPRAMASICCWPPESVPAAWRSRSLSTGK